MSMALLLFCLTVSFAIPAAHFLLVTMGVGGWGCPISSSVVRSVAASLTLRKSAPISALLTEAITFVSTVLSIWMPPLVGGRSEVEVGGIRNGDER